MSVVQERTEAETYDFQSSRVLVETSMLAAVSAISQFLLGMLRLESYMYYILPFPLVLSSIRSGPIAGRKTLMATFFLMLVIMGPTRALAYVVLFGPVGLGLGHLWHARWPWWFTVPICSAATVVSLFGFLFLLSYLIQENVFKLVIFNVYSVIVKTTAACGMQMYPSSMIIAGFLLAFLTIRSIFYVFILQFCYAILLTNMGYKVGSIPGILERFLNKNEAQF